MLYPRDAPRILLLAVKLRVELEAARASSEGWASCIKIAIICNQCPICSAPRLTLMHDAHPSELAGAAWSPRSEKKNARRVAWVEHRSTTDNITRL